MRRGASNAMLGLNQSLFDRGLQYRKGINDRGRRDARRDQKYAAFGAGVGGLANILSMIPGQPPPAPVNPLAGAEFMSMQGPMPPSMGAPGRYRNFGR
jgi:hypothetical protein